MGLEKTTNNQGIVTQNQTSLDTQSKGKLRSRDVERLVPKSHGEGCCLVSGIISVIAGAILLLAIIFWSVGVGVQNPGLELCGKIFFGLSLTTLLLSVPSLICAARGC